MSDVYEQLELGASVNVTNRRHVVMELLTSLGVKSLDTSDPEFIQRYLKQGFDIKNLRRFVAQNMPEESNWAAGFAFQGMYEALHKLDVVHVELELARKSQAFSLAWIVPLVVSELVSGPVTTRVLISYHENQKHKLLEELSQTD